MLMSIAYQDTKYNDGVVVVSVDPELVSCVEYKHEIVNIWFAEGGMPALHIPGGIFNGICYNIERHFSDDLNRPCPFMFITKNLFMNVMHVNAVTPAKIYSTKRSPPEGTIILIRGLLGHIDLPDANVPEITNQINDVSRVNIGGSNQ